MPGVPASGLVTVGTSGHKPEAQPARSGVYDEYFPIGSAPQDACPIHGIGALMPGMSGAVDGEASSVDADPAARVGTSGASHTARAGVMPVAYGSTPGRATSGTHLEKVVGADGRAVWVVRQ
jgi:hypothetical protein